MFDDGESRKLSTKELFALALCAEDFNIHFFNDWANRMRAFDSELVELLQALARDARQFRRVLCTASERLFADGLPELDRQLRDTVGRHINLPEQRYFVVSDREAKGVLSVALSLQKNTIRLLNIIDEALRTERGNGLLESATRFAASAARPGSSSGGSALRATL